MTYQDSVSYLSSFVDYERCRNFPYRKSLKLKRIQSFLDLIGNPHKRLKCVHIAGTKGKGSTAVFVAFILRQAGYRVGLYTSPHLNDFRERIRILYPMRIKRERGFPDFEGMISKRSICKLLSELKPGVIKFNRISAYGPLTFFEIWTSIAFLYFYRKKTDFVVLETGLGGRLDATNVVMPLVVGISPISLEHKHLLGNTLSKITREKSAIIKQINSIVVSALQEKSVSKVIKQRCVRQKAKLYSLGKDIRLMKIRNSLSRSTFSLKTRVKNYRDLKIGSGAGYQVVNAALALGIIESLRFYNILISEKDIRKGLLGAIWPGRFELIKQKPLIILDGAQNKASSLALKAALKCIVKKKVILILGVSHDKDIEGILNVILPLAKRIIITKSDNPRAMDPAEIMRRVLDINTDIDISLTNTVKDALRLAKICVNKTDSILVTGSLFVVGEARVCLI